MPRPAPEKSNSSAVHQTYTDFELITSSVIRQLSHPWQIDEANGLKTETGDS